MKKFLFLGIAATAMLASCTNDEVVEMNPQNAIGFESFVDKSTRATDITTGNLQEFSVWAYQGEKNILNKETVGKSIQNDELTTTNWKYLNTQYWVAGQNYVFRAIAPITCQEGDSYEYNGTSTEVSIKFTNGAGLTDLIYDDDNSVTSADPANQEAIEFTFNHLLSRVRFAFTETFPNEAITIVITDLKINGVVSEATYNGTKWAMGKATTIYEFTGEQSTAWNKPVTSEHLYFIPNKQDLNISFKVQAFQAGEKLDDAVTREATITDFEMIAGNSYEFTASFTEIEDVTNEQQYPIEFTVNEVTTWGTTWTQNAVTVE